MSAAGSLFCEHKKLRTSCATCKPAAMPAPTLDAKPFVSAEEREKAAPRARAKAEKPAAKPAAKDADESEEAKERRRGPGNPLMPLRSKKKGISAEEAASATAWWVKK